MPFSEFKIIDYLNSEDKICFNKKQEFFYKKNNIIGDINNVPSVNKTKITRNSINLPDLYFHKINNAKIIGSRLVIKDQSILKASFLNNRVIHEISIDNVSKDIAVIDNKFLNISKKIDKAIFLAGMCGSYQHWITETLPILYIYKKLCPDFDECVIIVGNDIKKYQLDLLETIGIKREKIYKKSLTEGLEINNLYISDVLSLNSFWISPIIKDAYNDIFSNYLKMSNKMASKDILDKDYSKIILGRQDLSNIRCIYNFDDFQKTLQDKHNYTVIYPENMSFYDKAHVFSNAKSIISLAGGGLCNIKFCKPGTNILAISPEDFPICTFRDLGEIYDLNVKYALTPSFSRFDYHNLNANSFLSNKLRNSILEEFVV